MEEQDLRDWKRIVVETDEENPISIAVITPSEVSPADGYRVRLTPASHEGGE